MNFPKPGECGCHRCSEKWDKENLPGEMTVWEMVNNSRLNRMILCEICGNKRCPHATDHTLACTNSNDSGQKGSVYE